MEITYVKGDIVALTKTGSYEVVAHGCNCFNTQTKGVALHFAKEFMTADPNLYRLEHPRFKGDINKLGQIEFRTHVVQFDQIANEGTNVIVINAYTQYKYGTQERNVDYDALRLCMRKINHRFKGKSVLLPAIGSGLAGGDWTIIERIIQQELVDCPTTVVVYERAKDEAKPSYSM